MGGKRRKIRSKIFYIFNTKIAEVLIIYILGLGGILEMF